MPSNTSIKVAPIGIKHLYKLVFSKQSKQINHLHIMLFKSWFAKAESALNKLIAKKNPYCLVAIENETLIGSIIIQPNNSRESCWSI